MWPTSSLTKSQLKMAPAMSCLASLVLFDSRLACHLLRVVLKLLCIRSVAMLTIES